MDYLEKCFNVMHLPPYKDKRTCACCCCQQQMPVQVINPTKESIELSCLTTNNRIILFNTTISMSKIAFGRSISAYIWFNGYRINKHVSRCFVRIIFQRDWRDVGGLYSQSEQWRIQLFYRYKRGKTGRITVLNIRKLYLYFVYFKLYYLLWVKSTQLHLSHFIGHYCSAY